MKIICCMILFLQLLMTTTVGLAASEVYQGMNFLQARKSLLANHWKPINIHKSNDYVFVGVEQLLIKHKIVEIESCAVDRAICIFNYRKKSACLRLETVGEEISQMKVSHISSNCP